MGGLIQKESLLRVGSLSHLPLTHVHVSWRFRFSYKEQLDENIFLPLLYGQRCRELVKYLPNYR